MKKKYSRILGVGLTLMLLASFFGFATPVSADNVAWSAIANPGTSLRTGLNLANVEVGPIAVTPDGGTQFAAVNCEAAVTGVGAPGTFTVPSLVFPDAVTITATGWWTTGTWTVPAGTTVAVTVTANVGVLGAPVIVGTTFTLPDVGDQITITVTVIPAPPALATGTFTIARGSVAVAVVPGSSPFTAITPHTAWALLQSADGGHNWRATGLLRNNGPITGIAVSSNFATDGTMYVAAWSTTLGSPAVFRSQDSGATFIELKAVPTDSALWLTTRINAIDMYPASPYPYVMVGTNTDVWVLQDAPFGNWMDQEVAIAPWWANIVEVAFAPDFATTNFIWAVVGNSGHVIPLRGVVTATNSPGAWGTILANTPALLGLAAVSATIGFPSDYHSTTAPYLWVGLNDGFAGGGIWRVRGLPPPTASQAIPQLAAVDIRSIAVSGSMATATILAGLDTLSFIVKSIDGGLIYSPFAVLKQPTGVNTTYVVMAPDFVTSNVAYVGTADGLTTESAFQVTRDGGRSWNQTGLIDTPFAVITDIAVVSLKTIFMVSDAFSLWKTEDATARAPVWERILTPITATWPVNVLANITFVATSPDFLTDGVVYATDNADGIMKTVDGGSIFAPMGDPGGPGIGAITSVHVVDYRFAFTGAFGNVYRTDDGGYSWLAAVTPPSPPSNIVSITTSPGYATDGTMLIGSATGWVFMSTNRGATFAAFPPTGIGAAATYVAFAPDYAAPTNMVFYAGGDALIVRLDILQIALGWVQIDGTRTMPMPTGVAVAGDAFSIMGTVAGPDTGVITVTAGSVSVTTTGNATFVPAPAPALPGSGAYSVPGSGDMVTVTATSAATTGTWTSTTGAAVAAITSDVGTLGVPVVTPGPGPFTLPDPAVVGASVINGLVMSPDGTLYGSNALPGQGVERSLNPTAFATAPVEAWIEPVFERMNTNLATTATLANLQLVVDETIDVTGSKNVFFAIDTFGVFGVDRIMTYTDTLATPVVLTGPETGTIYPRVEDVTLDWETLTGARSYHWQIARDARFSVGVIQGVSAYPTITNEQLRAGQTYYWRVRVASVASILAPVGSPLLSRWSESRTFTTELGGRIWHPFTNIGGVAPAPGAQDVLTKPTFQWNGADWATSYEFVLADNAAFTGATTKTLTTTSWVCDKDLGYSTTWYWKVRALSGTSESEWSDVGVFTTMAEPAPPIVVEEVQPPVIEVIIPEAPPVQEVTPVAPGYLLAIIIIGAVLVIFVVVLIVRTRRPV